MGVERSRLFFLWGSWQQHFVFILLSAICDVPVIANGAANKESVRFTHNVTFSCNDGHPLVGIATPKCQADGTLTSVPFCDAGEFKCVHVP